MELTAPFAGNCIANVVTTHYEYTGKYPALSGLIRLKPIPFIKFYGIDFELPLRVGGSSAHEN